MLIESAPYLHPKRTYWALTLLHVASEPSYFTLEDKETPPSNFVNFKDRDLKSSDNVHF